MIIFHQLGTEAYEQIRFKSIKDVEGSYPNPYCDTKGVPTIGIGFNLREEDIRREVLKEFGINPNDQNLSSAARAREKQYQDEIISALAKTYSSDTALQSALNDIIARRANDSLLSDISDRRTTFSFRNDDEVRGVFDAVIPSFEATVNSWLAGIPESNERAALVSLAYNSPSLLGTKLQRAIGEGDRAEAWFEIRSLLSKIAF